MPMNRGRMLVEIKPDFQRNFWIFVNEDTGYESVQRPSGHIKIEVREGRGKLWASVQNLLDNGKFNYRLLLLNMNSSGIVEPVSLGVLEIKRNKGELEWKFNPQNVANTGLRIEDFGAAAILVEYIDRENTSIICPLAAYRNKKIQWRNGLVNKLYIKRENHEAPVYDTTANTYGPDVQFLQPEQPLPENVIQAQWIQEPPVTEQPMVTEQPPVTQQPEEQIQYMNADNGLNTSCLYLNSNMCGAYVNTEASNPCMNCTMHHRAEAAESREGTGNIGRLRVELDNNFERYDPFNVKRSDYIWWKVNNPVNLNNILYQCNIRSPLLFNPAVMTSHFKYRHLIIGIYSDTQRGKDYVVCGVFGMHMVDRKPFGDMCKWVQTEGSKPRYGAFGYWIVYLDPGTGKILSLM